MINTVTIRVLCNKKYKAIVGKIVVVVVTEYFSKSVLVLIMKNRS